MADCSDLNARKKELEEKLAAAEPVAAKPVAARAMNIVMTIPFPVEWCLLDFFWSLLS